MLDGADRFRDAYHLCDPRLCQASTYVESESNAARRGGSQRVIVVVHGRIEDGERMLPRFRQRCRSDLHAPGADVNCGSEREQLITISGQTVDLVGRCRRRRSRDVSDA
jgi:hypothetical protein